ncbi:MAG: nicotinate-nucleotide adenylyltransferase [Candidatus Desulfacyla sp.]
MRIGILGGTFDPIHLGHLRSAEEICQELDLEKVYLIPSAFPPHKTNEAVTPFRHRLAMTRLAANMSPCLEAVDLEGRRPGHSYSIETLRELHRIVGPDVEIFFILGMDAFLEIGTWKEYEHLFDYAHFVIITRPGFETVSLGEAVSNLGMGIERESAGPDLFTAPSGKTVRLVNTTLMDISSTRIREMVRDHRSIRFLVPEDVGIYIAKNGFYR